MTYWYVEICCLESPDSVAAVNLNPVMQITSTALCTHQRTFSRWCRKTDAVNASVQCVSASNPPWLTHKYPPPNTVFRWGTSETCRSDLSFWDFEYKPEIASAIKVQCVFYLCIYLLLYCGSLSTTCKKTTLSWVCAKASSSLLRLLSWLSSFSKPRASSWAWRSASRCLVAISSTSSAWLCSTRRCSSAYTCQLSSSSFWALVCKGGRRALRSVHTRCCAKWSKGRLQRPSRRSQDEPTQLKHIMFPLINCWWIIMTMDNEPPLGVLLSQRKQLLNILCSCWGGFLKSRRNDPEDAVGVIWPRGFYHVLN